MVNRQTKHPQQTVQKQSLKNSAYSYNLQIIAHEIGHTFGFANEGKECQVPITAAKLAYGNIMQSAGASRAWSNCSRAVFEAYYLRNKENWCLPAQNKNICDLTSPDTDSKPLSERSYFVSSNILKALFIQATNTSGAIRDLTG